MKRLFAFLFVLFSISITYGQTIGNSSDGTSTDILYNNGSWINAARYLAPTNIVVTNIMARITSATSRYKTAIYSDNSQTPNSLLAQSVEVVNPSANGWYNFPLTSSVTLNGGQYYWLAIWSSSSASIYYSSGSILVRWQQVNYGAWPNSLNTSGGTTYDYCIYATNTVSQVVTNPPPPSDLTNTATVTIAWDHSPDDSVTGYNFYYGVATRNYTNKTDVGYTNLITIPYLLQGTTYYFAATAYNALGTESIYSEELVYTIPTIVVTNLPPIISDIPNQSMLVNTTSTPIPFNINDIDSPVNLLTLSITSSNITLINSNSFLVTGNGTNKLLTITPVTNQVGVSEITVTVRDNSNNFASDKFLMTVTNPPVVVNLPPTISDISNQTIFANYTSPKITFVINDVDSPINSLSLSLGSSNTALINNNSFLLTGTGTNRSLYITPVTNMTGVSEITIAVTDDHTNVVSDTFLVVVTNIPVNTVYTGMKIDYGTNFTSLKSVNKMAAIFVNPPSSQFYRGSLIITNGVPSGSTHIGVKLGYGTNFVSLVTTNIVPLIVFTNPPPNQFYRGSLIITNRAF